MEELGRRVLPFDDIRVIMEIKRINDNQIRCAITEQEIEELGFDIEEIIGNTAETQKFMNVLLDKIKEQEEVDIDLLSPMVRAELLPDHSMTVTFGGITEEEKKTMMDKVMEMMGRLADKTGVAVGQAGATEDSPKEEKRTKSFVEETIETIEEDKKEEVFTASTPFALAFARMEDAVRLSKYFLEKDEIPPSELFKLNEKYYLLMDLQTFSKTKLRPFATAAVEYQTQHIATAAGLAYIREHGKCIMKENAINALMQL